MRGPATLSIVLALLALLAGFAVGYLAGRTRRVAFSPLDVQSRAARAAEPAELPSPLALPSIPGAADDGLIAERARIVRSYEAEAARLRSRRDSADSAMAELTAMRAERARLAEDLAASRIETARYRQLVIDLENNAPPPLFGPGAPDDLKLIVGIGPVLERMLHQLGVTTFRQIARWSERDIDEFDAKLPEFPGRIRRDGWVTQARAMHQSKYGETLPQRIP
jgi:predicted flap endonuclease-1-like 5' DNA nuclease